MSSGPVLSIGLDELKLSILCNTVSVKPVRYIREIDSVRPLNRSNIEIPNGTSRNKTTDYCLLHIYNKTKPTLYCP